ncbi:MAG: helicase RepA family protein [Bdellovibrionales bacterium]|nr:helicase RepA family protein [Bdellovibrionales bacterium]
MALKIFSPKDLQARPGSNRFLIERLLPSAAVGVISGPPKCKKSWACAELLLSLSTGSKCFGVYEIPTPETVLYLPLEDSAEIVRSRLELMAAGRGISLSEMNRLMVCPTNEFRLDSDEALADLKLLIERHSIRFTVIDPLVRCLGAVSENHAGQLNTVLSSLRQIQIDSDCTILLVHHNKKGGKSGGEQLRGSGNLFSWIDFGYYCSKPTEQVTQIDLQYKGFPEASPVFFELKSSGAGIVPRWIGLDKQEVE